MCWTGKKSNKVKLKKDLSVIKIINTTKNGDLESLYTKFNYSLNVSYHTELDIHYLNNTNTLKDWFGRNKCTIQDGFHSWIYKDTTPGFVYIKVLNTIVFIQNFDSIKLEASDVHAIGNKDSLEKLNLTIVKGIIPKGSTCYINNNKDVVSDNIKLTEVISNYYVAVSNYSIYNYKNMMLSYSKVGFVTEPVNLATKFNNL